MHARGPYESLLIAETTCSSPAGTVVEDFFAGRSHLGAFFMVSLSRRISSSERRLLISSTLSGGDSVRL